MAARHTRNWRNTLLCGTALMPILGGTAVAQIAPDARPQGGQVVAGSASIAQDRALTRVQQASDRAVLDWRSFNIGRDHAVQFQQPSAASITLNRVTGPDPSVIAGRMTANGQIALVNQSGVLVTQGAQVQAQSVIISTADISNQAFMAGGARLGFDRPGQPGARIENQGSITVRDAGLAALVAPQVANRGSIAAHLGRVVLGGAETHVVDLHGDGLLSLEITGPVRRAAANGQALVSNTGLIDAAGGTVLLTTQAADGIVQDLVRAGGRISADGTASAPAGRVLVRGTGGTVRIEGEVTANAPGLGGVGGSIAAQADRVAVAGSARIEASGRAGGGRIALGTDRRGPVAPHMAPRMARRTTIAPGATLRADATERGGGGEVLVNSSGTTIHAGSISARGGPQGGDGGFVEVSGQGRLAITGGIDVAAPRGAAGTILLDPVSLSIVADDDVRLNIDPALLADGLLSGAEGGDSFLATGVVGGFAGNLRLEATLDLAVEGALTKALGGLALVAGRNLTINAPLVLQDADPALVLLLSGAQIAINALTQVPATGRINLQTPGFLGNNIAQSGAGRFVGGVLDSGEFSIPGSFDLVDLRGDNAIGSLGDFNAGTLLFRNTAPLTIAVGRTMQATQVRIDVEGGSLAVGGTVRGSGGPFAVRLRATGDIVVPAAGQVEGDGLSMIAGFDFAAGAPDAGAPDAGAAAALRLSGAILGAFSDGGTNDMELVAGAGGIQLTGAQVVARDLTLVAGSGGVAQTSGRLFLDGLLRVTTSGSATLAQVPADPLLENRILGLGASNVGGDFSLRANGLPAGIGLSEDIQVGGTLTLVSPRDPFIQNAGSRLLLGTLDATSPRSIDLGGANQIGVVRQLVGGGVNDRVRLRHVGTLDVPGRIASGGQVIVEVEGGDLRIGDDVRGGLSVALRASGDTALTAGSTLGADGNGSVTVRAGFNPVTGLLDLPGTLRLAGALGDAGGLNALSLGAGTGGIRQTGGRLVGRGASLVSGGDAILDRGGDQTGLRNALTGSLGSIAIPGDFVLDNGTAPILLAGSTITAANIGLRTEGVLSLADVSCFPSCASVPVGLDAGAGRVALRVGDLAVVPGAFIRGGLVELAPAVPRDLAVLFPAPQAGSLNLTAPAFASIGATTLRLGAATFRGVTETTATSLRFGGALALPGTLDLRSLGVVTQAPGADLDVTRLTGIAAGPVTLENVGNAAPTLGDFTATDGFALRTSGALRLDAALRTDGTARLIAEGAIDASAAGRIGAARLEMTAGGGITLSGLNTVATLGAVAAGGDITLANTGDLLLDGLVQAPRFGLALDVTGALTQSPGAGLRVAALSGRATAGAVLQGTNRLSRLDGFDAGTGDFLLDNTAPLLTLPSGRTLRAGGTLAIAQAGDLLIDGTATGATTTLDATGLLTVNGFSAIARSGDLLLRGDNVAVSGLISAPLGRIGVEAARTASLGGFALGGSLRVAASSISFTTLDATTTAVLLQLSTGGSASGSLDALALEVSGGTGVALTGRIASIGGGPAAAAGRRSSASGTLWADPPQPTAFLFNGCPIGVPLCGAVPPVPPAAGATGPQTPIVPELPSAPELPGPSEIPVAPAPGLFLLSEGVVTVADNPAAQIRGLDPTTLAGPVPQTRPAVPNLTSSFARDRAEAEDLAAPNIRRGDF